MITTSIFDLFEIGPGPSSSHTIGPMKAGFDFLQRLNALPADVLQRADRVEMELLGSLSATGKGHGTDRAVLVGLLGYTPLTCPDELLDRLSLDLDQAGTMTVHGKTFPLNQSSVVFGPLHHVFPYSNTLLARLHAGSEVLFEMEYYSIGGGFLTWKGWEEPERGKPVFPYNNMKELRKAMLDNELRLHELVLENERAITGMREKDIFKGVDRILDVMEASVKAGLNAEGVLPGPLKLHRKAGDLFNRANSKAHIPDRFLTFLCAYAFAASEENAAGHRVVTAPTCGSAGVIPGLYYAARKHMHISQAVMRQSFLAAATIGFIAKHNASVSGAEVGCQGEVGVACAMGAAMLANASSGGSIHVVENAAETALEQHLGMTCDPVGGYVQIPCIERNGMGAVKAYASTLIAETVTSRYHRVGLDETIQAMMNTGRDMNANYRETSQGGLAMLVSC